MYPVPGQGGAASGRTPIETLRHWLDDNADTLLDDPSQNLVAIGIGRKSAGPIDDASSSLCITGFVERKLSERELAKRGVETFARAASAVARMHESKADVTIDVVEAGSSFSATPELSATPAQRGVHGGLFPTVNLRKRFERLRSGLGITNPHRQYPKGFSVGTLGFFVRDDRERTFLVSNNHVIAGENSGKTGDDIVQPGSLDLTEIEMDLLPTLRQLVKNLGVAKLSAFVPIAFHGPVGIPFNEVDCAAAELDKSRRDHSELGRVGLGGRLTGVAPPLAIDPTTGQLVGSARVYKAGRTTGWTEGRITQIAVVSNVRFGPGSARFRNQIAIAATPDNSGPFSRPGDSGSGIVDDEQRLVGLLFAGSDLQTLANPIDAVLRELRSALGVSSLTVVT